MKTEKNIYSVKQINFYVKRMFEEDTILKNVYVRGEISNCKYHHSGHIYFSLKDESGVLSSVMFASYAASLKMHLEDGMQVVVFGSVTVYERDGRYQLYARKIEEDGTGELYRRFEELKERLAESGMFAPEYKQPIPEYAMHIGVVTAETGAVIRDIYNVASRRNPYCQIVLYPASVQGKGAAGSICAGIEALDRLGLDCIIVGRGGGSMEDLWCFNEESVARAIFNCNTPVISAVGHETDFTIADFVADLRAPTPSAAAELAVFDYAQFLKDLERYRNTLNICMSRRIDNSRSQLSSARLKLEKCSPQHMALRYRQELTSYEDELRDIMSECLKNDRARLSSLKQPLRMLMDRNLTESSKTLGILSERLSGLSPLKRLSQGYAYVSSPGGYGIRSISQVNEGDIIDISLTDGQISAVVKDKKVTDHE